MGIREKGYRHWGGFYTGHATRWWSIARQAIRATVYNKLRLFGLLGFIFLVWAPYIFFALFWFLAGAELGSLVGPADDTLREFLYRLAQGWQVAMFPIFAAYVATPTVSNDLRSNALYIYLAKPLRRTDYILGKLVATAIWVLPISILPNLFVLAGAVASSSKSAKIEHPGAILGEILLVQLVFVTVLSLTILALSSLTKRWQVAFMSFVGGYYVLWIMSDVLQDATRQRTWMLLAPSTNLINFAKHVLHQHPSVPAWETSLLLLVGLAAVALGLFLWRVLRLEVAE